jgi:signal transduction histidine kinase
MSTGHGSWRTTLGSQLSDTLDVGVLICDDANIVEFTNRRFRDLFEIDPEGDVTHAFNELRRAIEQVTGQSFRTLRNGEAVIVEFDADSLDVKLRIECHHVDGMECAGRLLLIHDLEAVEGLRERLRLVLRYRRLTRALGMLAHDLKAPLNALVLNLEIVRGEIDRNLEAAAREVCLESIASMRGEFRRLERMLSESLEQYREVPAEPRRFDLSRLLSRLANLIRPLCRAQHVELLLEPPPRGTRMIGDPDRLKQVLVNIAVNALDAMGDGGGRLFIRGTVAGGQIALEVADTGPGIPAHALERIFDLDYTTKPAGTGIGLFVARAIVRELGGSIRAANRAEGGTIFKIELPLEREDESGSGAHP